MGALPPATKWKRSGPSPIVDSGPLSASLGTSITDLLRRSAAGNQAARIRLFIAADTQASASEGLTLSGQPLDFNVDSVQLHLTLWAPGRSPQNHCHHAVTKDSWSSRRAKARRAGRGTCS